MKKQDEALFQLIKSMSRHEKGYFMKYATSQPGKKGLRYIELFKAMESLKSYNEKALEKKLNKINFSKYPHRVRYYLYNIILNCLEQYHRESSSSDKLLILLRQANILSNRKLYSQSNHCLEKAEKISEFTGKSNLKYEVARIKLVNRQALYSDEADNSAMKIVNEMHDSARILLDTTDIFKTAFVLSWHYHNEGPAKNAQQKSRYRKIFEPTLKRVNINKLDLAGKLTLFNAQFSYGLCTGSRAVSVRAMENLVLLLRKNLRWVENKKVLAACSFNLFNLYAFAGKFDKAEKELLETEKWLAAHQRELTKDMYNDFVIRNNMQWFILLNTDHNRVNDEKLFAKVFSFFSQLARELPGNKDFFYYSNAAIYYAYRGEDKKALDYINMILNEKKHRENISPVLAETELLNIFIHSKLGNLDLTESLLLNLKRKIKNYDNVPHANFANAVMEYYFTFPGKGSFYLIKQWTERLIHILKQYFKKNRRETDSLNFDYIWYFENVFLKKQV